MFKRMYLIPFLNESTTSTPHCLSLYMSRNSVVSHMDDIKWLLLHFGSWNPIIEWFFITLNFLIILICLYLLLKLSPLLFLPRIYWNLKMWMFHSLLFCPYKMSPSRSIRQATCRFLLHVVCLGKIPHHMSMTKKYYYIFVKAQKKTRTLTRIVGVIWMWQNTLLDTNHSLTEVINF